MRWLEIVTVGWGRKYLKREGIAGAGGGTGRGRRDERRGNKEKIAPLDPWSIASGKVTISGQQSMGEKEPYATIAIASVIIENITPATSAVFNLINSEKCSYFSTTV